jgi:transposase-like protein
VSNISAPHFHDEEKAYEYVEARLWPQGAVCPHCGGVDRVGKLQGKTTRPGLWKCYQCRKPFTVKIGTIFEGSKVPMRLWLQAMYLIAGSKKGISSNQLHRILGVTLKTAWFMSHRIREAMRTGGLAPMGSGGGIVEIDETFIGNNGGPKSRMPIRNMNTVIALVDRTTGRSTSMVFNGNLTAAAVAPIVSGLVAKDAHLMTDEAQFYKPIGKGYASHTFVSHTAGEYVRKDDRTIHTNTIEGYFSIFKRGMRGVYQHCGKQHLHRYLAEFDFRYSNRSGLGIQDTERADRLLLGVVGKRLTYETTRARP